MACPKVIYPGERGKNSWLRYINHRIFNRNENFLAGVIGPTGSGKTYCGLSIGEMLRDDFGFHFNIDHCVFSFLDLMRLINEGDLKRGSIILFDEPQAELSAKSHQSITNKVFYQLTSTFRHRGFVLLFCNPFLEDLDKSTRKLFHASFLVQGKDSKNRTASIKPLYLEWSSAKNDWYRNFLRIVHKPEGKSKHRTDPLKSWNIPHPSDELAKAYEIKKREFTDKLNSKIQAQLEALEAKDNKSTNPLDKLTDKQREAIEVRLKHNTLGEAAEELGTSIASVSKHLAFAEKKGVTLKNYEMLRDSDNE